MKKLVIIGGGFTGSFIAKNLENEFDVTLIDSKDYFEYTPSVLRCIVEPDYIKKIQVMHDHYLKKAKVINGCVKDLDEKEVIVNEEKIRYDYLIIASGSSYEAPFKEQNIVRAFRAKHLRDSYEKLKKAEEVLIIGGGIVGIELAGEILYKYKNKKITLVHSKECLIERCNDKAIDYAYKYLKKKKVRIIFNERIVEGNNKEYFTNNGRKIETDITFLCVGIRPNFDFLKNNFSNILCERNLINVNDYLQVEGYENIFAGGDITNIMEEKTAQNAEKHAEVIIENLRNLENKNELIGYMSKRRMLDISLGKYSGIMNYKNFCLTGIIPAALKVLIEWKTMKGYK
jgi:apoptosis-inducing factor 2